MFFWKFLAFLMIQRMWQFDLWFLCLFYIQLEHLEVHSSHTVEAWLGELWAFFGIAFLWDWNENWPFPVHGHCWVFQICWHIECSTFTTSYFRIWNSSAGIPSPLLALFVTMFPKAHLILYSRMSGSRWVITPSWLSGY